MRSLLDGDQYDTSLRKMNKDEFHYLNTTGYVLTIDPGIGCSEFDYTT